MSPPSPDPVAAPSEYQALLLGLLGEADPAEMQAALGGELAAIVADAGGLLRERPSPGEWSVLELLGHLVDAEVVSAARYRWILAEDEPLLIGYDQDRWVERLDHNQGDPQELLALFGPLRRANLALWAATPAADRARVGRHAERGPESFDLSFRLIAGHGVFHLDQARRTLQSLRAS